MSQSQQPGMEVYHDGLHVVGSPKSGPPPAPSVREVQSPPNQFLPYQPPPGGSEYGHTHPVHYPQSHSPVSQYPQGSLYTGAKQPTIVSEKRTSICGMRPVTFFLVLALIFTIVAAAVGGGVGGSMAVESAKRDAEARVLATAQIRTVTVTATAGAPAAASTANGATPTAGVSVVNVPTAGRLALDCPNLNGQTSEFKMGGKTWQFTSSCGADYNGNNIDILALVAYNYEDCMRACASYNRNLGANRCIAVAFSTDLTNFKRDFQGTCFLKNATGVENNTQQRTNIGAKLVLTQG